MCSFLSFPSLLQQADDFLGRMHWTSRSEGHLKQLTSSRRTVQTFVIIDKTGFTSKVRFIGHQGSATFLAATQDGNTLFARPNVPIEG